MKKALAFALLALLGCKTVRSEAVYKTETEFTNMVVTRQAPSVVRMLRSSCSCVDDHWSATSPDISDRDCQGAADWWFTYTSRWAWHMAMVRYNGNLTTVDPGSAPAITAVSCDLPSAPVTQ